MVGHYTEAQADVVLVPASAGRRIRVWAYEFSTNASGSFQFRSDGSIDIGCEKWFSANAGAIGDMVPYITEPNDALTVETTCDGPHSVAIWYTLV